MNNKLLASICVDQVRQSCIQMMTEIKDCDPWDENIDGVAWLDNEVGAFLKMLSYTSETYKTLTMSSPIDHSDYFSIDSITKPGACLTVAAAEERLSKLPMELLAELFDFLKLGGTGSDLWKEWFGTNQALRIAG